MAWNSYDLLSKNCNHFCDEFCERLGVPKLPGWVNCFANISVAALEVAGNKALRVWFPVMGGPAPDSLGNSNRGSPRFQATWFKNLITSGAKPSSSAEIDNQDEDVHLRQQGDQVSDLPSRRYSQQWESELPAQQNSRHDDSKYVEKACRYETEPGSLWQSLFFVFYM
ncbi:hypothetical protein GH714_028704 [Hevea brasiliensis]|uniref:PPPDE domain-containing protein n=1 Tax=Hevea brasiliensis TaxID=3981 RepID=A0A6A6MIM4_HEVBR|nr:hypothetical protein GH714_028704 [Hevea brasiliensis]